MEFVQALERDAPVKPFFLRPLAPFGHPVAFGTARGIDTTNDPYVAEVPREVGPELRAVVGLDALDGHREPVREPFDEADRRLDAVLGGALQDLMQGDFINRGELVEAARAPFEGLEIHLDGLHEEEGDRAPSGPGAVVLERHRGTRRSSKTRRILGGMKVGRDSVRVNPAAEKTIVPPLDSAFPVPAEPHVKMGQRDLEEPATLAELWLTCLPCRIIRKRARAHFLTAGCSPDLSLLGSTSMAPQVSGNQANGWNS